MSGTRTVTKSSTLITRFGSQTALLCGTSLGLIAIAQPAAAQVVPTCTLPEVAPVSGTGNILINSGGARGRNGSLDLDDLDKKNAGNGAAGGQVFACGTHNYDSGPIQPTIVRTVGGRGGTGLSILFAGTAGAGGAGGNGGPITYQASGLDSMTVAVNSITIHQ